MLQASAIELHGDKRVLVVDDDFGRAKVLRHILASGGYGVSHAGSGEEGLSVLQNDAPDAVLLDLVLPGMSGLQVCRQIKSDPACSGAIVIMISAELIDPDRQADGLEAGADDYVPWPTTRRGLLTRLELAMKKAAFPTALASGVALTRRQREVVALIAGGLTCRAIADRLGISLRTAETHRAQIMRRLRLHTTAELVRYALNHGLGR